MTITLSPELESRLAEVASAAGVTPDAFAARLIDGALADQARALSDLTASLDEAEAEAEREGWLDGDTVFRELVADLKSRA